MIQPFLIITENIAEKLLGLSKIKIKKAKKSKSGFLHQDKSGTKYYLNNKLN